MTIYCEGSCILEKVMKYLAFLYFLGAERGRGTSYQEDKNQLPSCYALVCEKHAVILHNYMLSPRFLPNQMKCYSLGLNDLYSNQPAEIKSAYQVSS